MSHRIRIRGPRQGESASGRGFLKNGLEGKIPQFQSLNSQFSSASVSSPVSSPAPPAGMSSAAGSSYAANSARSLPLIQCPDCGKVVKRHVSTMKEHPGWRFYRCKMHKKTCSFWHWEGEYEEYLIEHGHLAAADQGVHAYEQDVEVTMAVKKKMEQEAGKQADEMMPVMLVVAIVAMCRF